MIKEKKKKVIIVFGIFFILSILVFTLVQTPYEKVKITKCDNDMCVTFNNYLKYLNTKYEIQENGFSIDSLQKKEQLLKDAGLN